MFFLFGHWPSQRWPDITPLIGGEGCLLVFGAKKVVEDMVKAMA